MNDSDLYEIPEDVGCLRPFVLSIGIHILLGGLLWIGSTFHQASTAEDTAARVDSPPKQHSNISAANESPRTSPDSAHAAPIQANTGALKANIVKAESGESMLVPTAAPKNAAIADRTRGTSQQSKPGSGTSSKPKHGNSKLAAARSIEKLSSKEKKVAKAGTKTGAPSPKRIAKAEPTKNTKKDLAKRSEKKSAVAEMKKLESLREAELRRISKNVS